MSQAQKHNRQDQKQTRSTTAKTRSTTFKTRSTTVKTRSTTVRTRSITIIKLFFKTYFAAFIIYHLIAFAHGSPVDFTPLRTSLEARASTKFVHPGIFLHTAQLDFIKAKVKSGRQPWTDGYKKMIYSSLGSLTRSPKPRATVECGFAEVPNHGCTNESGDALAAYVMSLAWYITDNAQYAQKAISYMNAWAKTIKTHTNVNALIQTAWAATSWTRAAEIIRYTNADWSAGDIATFENMLRKVYLPNIIVGSDVGYNGNWELVMMEASMNIAIFLNDRATYDKAMAKFLARVPAYIYMTTDGRYPKAPVGSGMTTPFKITKFWHGQQIFPQNGIVQETCRDMTHTGMGLSSISHVAETAQIQGTDLYSGDVGNRLMFALEFHTNLELHRGSVPSWLCNGKMSKEFLGNITEVGFNALSSRMGRSMPSTKTYTLNHRPADSNFLFFGWETLTHPGSP